ncbi:ACT domain-containing protein [Desulfovibrio sp. OttesenSCG-928-C06]|nr:ACT domain-containing protein [Desulfovibrio sp. OttesenSCG-928-C06]
MKTIITVLGNDRPGIVAGVAAALYNLNVNILDISQTIMDGYFTMTMLVDMEKAVKPFDEAKAEIVASGEPLGVNVRVQRAEIFDAMHKL